MILSDCIKFILQKLFSVFELNRAKSNLKFKRVYSNKVDKMKGLRCDQIIKLTGIKTAKDYPENPEKLRRIKYYDKELDKMIRPLSF